MTRTDESTATRVTSRDGTEIAHWTTGGDGQPLVLAHGATADHTRWEPLLPYLERHAAVYAMDRRGRGASGDGPDYDLEREYEDVAAVVDSVARYAGCAVDLLGHSYGGLCAFGAAALTANLRRLVLYEGWPTTNPDAWALPDGVEYRLEALLAEGSREAVLETFFREVVGMPEKEFAVYHALPAWQPRIAAAHTITRELRAEARATFEPGQAAKITVPTLMLVGGDSPATVKRDYEAITAALTDVRVTVLDGQQHIAMDTIPQTFAEHVNAFLSERP